MDKIPFVLQQVACCRRYNKGRGELAGEKKGLFVCFGNVFLLWVLWSCGEVGCLIYKILGYVPVMLSLCLHYKSVFMWGGDSYLNI